MRSISLGSRYIELGDDMKKALCNNCKKVYEAEEIVLVYSKPKDGYYLCRNCYESNKGKLN